MVPAEFDNNRNSKVLLRRSGLTAGPGKCARHQAATFTPSADPVPAAITASGAFMMPVATPPNTSGFGSGHMHIQSMSKAGVALNLIGVVLEALVSYLLVRLIWSH
jgi:hypothetical protein